MLRAAIVVMAIGVLAGCADTVPGYSAGVQPLAKAEGWRSEVAPPEMPFGLVEVAYDPETGEQAWAENVPEGLGEADPKQGEQGRYGSLDDVNFNTQLLVVWHSGQSGSCPGWLADIDSNGDLVFIERGEYVPEDACTDDYNPYRMVLAVDRDRLPDEAWLPSEAVVIGPITDGRISTYPDERVTSQGG